MRVPLLLTAGRVAGPGAKLAAAQHEARGGNRAGAGWLDARSAGAGIDSAGTRSRYRSQGRVVAQFGYVRSQYRRQTTNLKAYGFAFSVPVPGFSIPSIVGPFSVLDTRAAAQQSVLNFSDVRKYQASKATLAAVKFDNDATRSQVSDEVARGYLACLRADADRDTGRANVELSEALLAQAQRAQTAGTGTGIEVTRAEVQLANDRQRLIRAENDRTRATLQLLKSMGLRMDSSIEFTDKLDYKPIDPASSETLLEQARKARFEMKTQQQREEAARLSHSAVKAERLPTIGASADYGAIGADVVSSRATYTMGVSLRCRYSTAAAARARAKKVSRNINKNRSAPATWASRSNCRCAWRSKVCARRRLKWTPRAKASASPKMNWRRRGAATMPVWLRRSKSPTHKRACSARAITR